MQNKPNALSDESQDLFYEVQARHYRQCRWEAIVVALIWATGLIWSCSVIIGMGYLPVDQRPEVPQLVWGMPSWVFWGLFVPWFAMILATWWYALFVLKDDEPCIDMPPQKKPPTSSSDFAKH